MIWREGEPVDLTQEPCATEPNVAALAPHYRWVRAQNQRYTIYIGQGMLMHHALVVLDRWAEVAQVVAAHKISAMETIRGFLWQ